MRGIPQHPSAVNPLPSNGPDLGHRARLDGVGMQPIRIVVVDDHPAILDAIATAIRGAPDLTLAGTAGSLDAVRTLVGSDAPVDVVVADVQLDGDAEGLRLLDTLGADGPAVLLLSSFDQPPLIRAAFERGAAGYLLKTAEVTEILAAIRIVAGGGTAFSASMLSTVRSAPRRPSDREIEVLALLCAGASNDEIGARLGVTEKTVESHLRRLFDRYGVLSRTELAVLALREGWVSERQRA